jgi:hypothetical protein
MTRLGDIPPSDKFYDEAYVFQNPAVNIASGQSSTVTVATYTMPMAGTLTASLAVVASWVGMQHYVADIAFSSPAPTANFPTFAQEESRGATIWVQSKALALWSGLAKGTIVTVNCRFTAWTAAPTITAQWIYGWLRASKQ